MLAIRNYFIILARRDELTKLGLTTHSAKYSHKYFYNTFVSQILYRRDSEEHELVRRCQEMLENVAYVKLEMTQTDSLVLSEEEASRYSFLAIYGGLLSLYMGFSLMSLAELAFWLARGIVSYKF